MGQQPDRIRLFYYTPLLNSVFAPAAYGPVSFSDPSYSAKALALLLIMVGSESGKPCASALKTRISLDDFPEL
ncbi:MULTISPECIES: hypothetical protein [Methylomicrobium]|uniref:hypothetical protein n=1 Tax=Methylomicrobium TaxID=39773 RepID=UPI0012F64083|nr:MULTISPECIES: hypothetical protein [Methylomicrobium]